MARHSWSMQDAKSRFSALVAAARRAPQTVTRHGKPAVVVLDAEEYARLQNPDERPAKPALTRLLQAVPERGELIERLDNRLRKFGF